MNEYEIKTRMRIFEDYLRDLISLDEYTEKMFGFKIDAEEIIEKE